MEAKIENVRTSVSMGVLWKWTGVSAFIHAGIIAALCGVSYIGFKQRETIAKAKEASLEAIAKAKEADDAAKAAAAPPVVAGEKPAPAAPGTPPATPGTPATVDPAKKQIQAENVLGIDKVAKPDEIPKSPFATKGDDLLKDLK